MKAYTNPPLGDDSAGMHISTSGSIRYPEEIGRADMHALIAQINSGRKGMDFEVGSDLPPSGTIISI